MIGANSFADYIAKGITHLVVQILTAIVLFLVISIVLKIMIYILDVVSWLPIIGGINRVVGAVLGFAMALILVWIVFLIFTMLYTTQAGQENFQTDQWKRFPAIFVPEQLYIEDSYGASLIREASFINFLKYSCIKGRQLDII